MTLLTRIHGKCHGETSRACTSTRHSVKTHGTCNDTCSNVVERLEKKVLKLSSSFFSKHLETTQGLELLLRGTAACKMVTG